MHGVSHRKARLALVSAMAALLAAAALAASPAESHAAALASDEMGVGAAALPCAAGECSPLQGCDQRKPAALFAQRRGKGSAVGMYLVVKKSGAVQYEYSYNRKGLLARQSSTSGGHSVSYKYKGEMISSYKTTWAGGSTSSGKLKYGKKKRLEAVSETNSSTGGVSRTLYKYNRKGRVSKRVCDGFTTRYDYYEDGKVLKHRREGPVHERPLEAGRGVYEAHRG